MQLHRPYSHIHTHKLTNYSELTIESIGHLFKFNITNLIDMVLPLYYRVIAQTP